MRVDALCDLLLEPSPGNFYAALTHTRSPNSREAVVRTFLRHTGVPGIVPLLRRFVTDRVAALGPPQHAEGSVQPLEGAAPH